MANIILKGSLKILNIMLSPSRQIQLEHISEARAQTNGLHSPRGGFKSL